MPAFPWTRWTLFTLALLAFIFVPFALFEAPISTWAEALLDSDQSKSVIAVVVAGLLAADVLLPVPSSLISTAAGYLLGFFPAVAVSWTGMTIGCCLGYLAGRWAGRAATAHFVNQSEIAQVAAARDRYGDWMLILFRAVPVLAEASVILAGFARMSPVRFLAMTAPANLGISVAYAAVGTFAVGANSFLLAFAGAILVPAIFWGIARWMWA